MTIRPLHKLRRLAGRLRDRMGPRAAILLYHRVADTPTDPYLLRVRTKNFEEQMDVLKRRRCVIPLRELATRHRARNLPHNAVAITFDDGYVDNLATAKPILEARGLPATVFMTAGTVGREREFWWDELERTLLGAATLPPSLDTSELFEGPVSTDPWLGRLAQEPIRGKPTLGRGAQATTSPSQDLWEVGSTTLRHESHVGWNLTDPDDPTPRHALLRAIHTAIRVMAHEPRQAVLDRLRAWAGVANEVRPEFRAMSHDEMHELARGDLIEVGAHTITHPSLPALSLKAKHDEIAGSAGRLREILGRAVTSFAYPYGDRDDATVNAVAEAGYETACVCEGRIAVPRSHPLRLPRLDVLDWDGETFERQLERWLRG